MTRYIIVDDEGSEIKRGHYKKWKKRFNTFYAKGKKMNLQSMSRFDEKKKKWVPVLKRKWY